MSLALEVNGKNVPYVGGPWAEYPLHCWRVGRMSLTLVASWKNVSYIVGQLEECILH